MSIKWTDEELAIIEAKAEVYTVKQIASILKRRGYQRTPIAIYLKLNSLGYSARPTLDNYSCKEIAQVLQLNFSTVTRWVKRGWLKATRRSARHYQIRIWHLQQFFENPPQSIKKRNDFVLLPANRNEGKWMQQPEYQLKAWLMK